MQPYLRLSLHDTNEAGEALLGADGEAPSVQSSVLEEPAKGVLGLGLRVRV
jgi:hypothetical protein